MFDKAPEAQWFEAFEKLAPLVLTSSDAIIRDDRNDSVHVAHAGSALDFLRHGLFALENANKAGHHAIAISLLRQCVDPLFIIECGILADFTSKAALEEWATDRPTMGRLRKKFGERIWSFEPSDFLGVQWPAFMCNLYNEVQEYAHFNFRTVQWTMNSKDAKWGQEGMIESVAETWKYDAEKGTRITQFQSIIVYVLGRTLVTASKLHGWRIGGLSELLEQYHAGMQRSRLIGKPFDWKRELLGMSCDLPPLH